MTDSKRRSKIKPVKEGYLPIGEFTSPVAAASAPFGEVHFPLPIEKLNYEHSAPQPERIDRPE